jgi:hypothetical protein
MLRHIFCLFLVITSKFYSYEPFSGTQLSLVDNKNIEHIQLCYKVYYKLREIVMRRIITF